MSPAEAIRADRLTKRFGSRLAVDHISFSIPMGSITGVVGPNGSGKTTTFRMLLGLSRPTDGSAEVLGHPVRDPHGFLSRVGALVEEPAFHPRLSARQNLQVLARLAGVDDRRVDEAISRVGIDASPRAMVSTLSLGNRQRLAIAGALLGEPELLVLDEPGNGLDAIGLRDLRRFLGEFAEAGGTVFVSSHLLGEIEHLCDRVLVLNQGRVAHDGLLADLLRGRERLMLRTDDLADLQPLAALCERAGHRTVIRRDRLVVHAPPTEAGRLNRLAMEHDLTIIELRHEVDDLETALVDLVGTGPASFVDAVPP